MGIGVELLVHRVGICLALVASACMREEFQLPHFLSKLYCQSLSLFWQGCFEIEYIERKFEVP